MPRTSVLVDFDELVLFAQDNLGYNYNKAFGLLEWLRPSNGESTTYIDWSEYVSDKGIDENLWRKDDETKIMVSYMVEHNLNTFEIVEDN
jgi:hypothetical protein